MRGKRRKKEDLEEEKGELHLILNVQRLLQIPIEYQQIYRIFHTDNEHHCTHK